MPKLTIMVSLYNSGEWIHNRLLNLSQCDLKDAEIWCVNANSPDPQDHEIPQQFPCKYVKLPSRLTVYETWNYIIQNSDSEYIANANTDDLVAPDCYSRLIGNLESQKGDLAYCSWHTTALANQNWSDLSEYCSDRPGQFAGDINLAGVGHFPLWRRSLHDSLGLFDPRFKALADADWWSRCYYVGMCKFIWVQECLGLYLWRNGENLWHRQISESEWSLYHEKLSNYKRGVL